MDDDEKEIDEGGFKMDGDEDLESPPEVLGEDFGLEDPDDKYH